MNWRLLRRSEEEDPTGVDEIPEDPQGSGGFMPTPESEENLPGPDSDVILESEEEYYDPSELSDDEAIYAEVDSDELEEGEVYVDPDLEDLYSEDGCGEEPSAEERVIAPQLSAPLARQLDQVGRRVLSEVGETRDGSIVVGFFSVTRDEGVDSLTSAFAVHAAENGEQVTFLRRSKNQGRGWRHADSAEVDELPRSRRVMTQGSSFMVVEAASSSELLRCVLSAKDVCSEREMVVVDAASLEEEPGSDRLLRLLDAAVLVTRFGTLDWERGERSLARLKECGVRIIGAVMTDCPTG